MTDSILSACVAGERGLMTQSGCAIPVLEYTPGVLASHASRSYMTCIYSPHVRPGLAALASLIAQVLHLEQGAGITTLTLFESHVRTYL